MANRKTFTSKQVQKRAAEINTAHAAHGVHLAVEGGGPLQIVTVDRLGHRTRLSPWLTRQNALTWLDAFELGIVYAMWGQEAAGSLVKPDLSGWEA